MKLKKTLVILILMISFISIIYNIFQYVGYIRLYEIYSKKSFIKFHDKNLKTFDKKKLICI